MLMLYVEPPLKQILATKKSMLTPMFPRWILAYDSSCISTNISLDRGAAKKTYTRGIKHFFSIYLDFNLVSLTKNYLFILQAIIYLKNLKVVDTIFKVFSCTLEFLDGWMENTYQVSQSILNNFFQWENLRWWNKFTNFQIQCVFQDNPKRSSHIWWAYHFSPIHIGGMYFESFVRRGTFGPDVFIRKVQKIYSSIIRVYLTISPRKISKSFTLKSSVGPWGKY